MVLAYVVQEVLDTVLVVMAAALLLDPPPGQGAVEEDPLHF
jgi:hypothetical protein